MDFANDKIKVVNDTKIEPKILPFRCPVCNGFGTLKHGSKICSACGGKGYITVSQEGQDGKQSTIGERLYSDS